MAGCPFKAKFIVNPQASKGKVGWEWPKIKEGIDRVLGKVDFEFTTGPGIGTILTRRAIEEKFDLIVAVGGDGTVSDVANGFFDVGQQLNPEAVLGALPTSVGSDFVRSLGYPPEWDQALTKFLDTNSAVMDLGHFRCLGDRGEEVARYFVNVADFGLGGEMLNSVKNQTGLFGGKIQFFLGAAKALMKFKNKVVTYRVDDGPETTRAINSMVIANGQFFAGGMWVAPNARLDDGQLDLLIVDQMDQMAAYKKMQSFYDGSHIHDPAIKCSLVRSLHVASEEPIKVDIDGEPIGRLPITFDVAHQVIRVKV